MTLLERLLPGLAAYPDIHPMFVHFPIALAGAAFLFAALAMRGPADRVRTARILLHLTAAAAVVTAATGLRAASHMAHAEGTPVETHEAFMLTATGMALALSAFSWWKRTDETLAGRGALLGGLVALNAIMLLGADRGALTALDRWAGLDLALPQAARPERRAETTGIRAGADRSRGESLYRALDCAGCHGSESAPEAPGIPPSLRFAGSRYRAEWMERYLQAPHRRRWIDEGERPTVRMPDFQLDPGEAADLAAFLATRVDSARFPSAPVTEPPLSEDDAAKGRELMIEYACTGCHRVDGKGRELGPPLDGVGNRLQDAYLYAFLKDPGGLVPGTPMKKLHLWDEEARELTAYLTTLRAGGAGNAAGKENEP
jgi:cytochrome c2/uncharacterized membrane protein